MGNPQVSEIRSSDLTPQQHIESARYHIENAEELQDVPSAQLEADLAMVHLMAAGIKLCHSLLGGKRAAGGAAVLSMLSKIAK